MPIAAVIPFIIPAITAAATVGTAVASADAQRRQVHSAADANAAALAQQAAALAATPAPAQTNYPASPIVPYTQQPAMLNNGQMMPAPNLQYQMPAAAPAADNTKLYIVGGIGVASALILVLALSNRNR